MSHRACRVEVLDDPPGVLALARAWGGTGAHVALLESADTAAARGRWSFLGVDPWLVFRSKRGACWAGPPGEEVALAGSPLDELAALLARYRVAAESLDPMIEDLPFRGGAMGYLGYELLYLIERVGDQGRDDRPVPDCVLGFYDAVIAHDAKTGRALVIANGFAETAAEARGRADARLAEVVARVKGAGVGEAVVAPVSTSSPVPSVSPSPSSRRRLTEEDLVARGITPVLPRAAYLGIVEAAKEHILAGDVFELCTSNRFDTTFAGDGLALYDALRTVSPAPHAAYLRLPGVEVLSSSPERFLRFDRDGWAETRPIKGTRPRGATDAEDRTLRGELADSAKDRAEHVMIVDVSRNDLGRVCDVGTVGVPSLLALETYPFTHQLVSTVRGRVRAGVGPIDLVKAVFPGGSMTGAPKVEAMKLIDRLEPVKRGIFAGAIGYFDLDGPFDLSIVIRTFIKRGADLSFHVGGAIVSDSDPTEEHQELLDKAAGLVAALDAVGGIRSR